MINKDQLMKDEIKRLTELVTISHGEIKENYKSMVKDLMNAIAHKDWQLLDECQQIINETLKQEKGA